MKRVGCYNMFGGLYSAGLFLLLKTGTQDQVRDIWLGRKSNILAQRRRRREKQKQDFIALSCEKPIDASGYKVLLVLTGEAGYMHDFLCVSAPPRDAWFCYCV